MAQVGQIELLGTTFSDHMPAYFDSSYNQDNNLLASQTLESIYAVPPSDRTFWIPERVADADVLSKVSGMGYNYTFVDQMRHLWKWQGRAAAISDDGYRINRYHGVNCFMINDVSKGILCTAKIGSKLSSKIDLQARMWLVI